MVKILDLVAFGNSLTVGFVPFRIATQPYSRFLQEMVDDFLKERRKESDLKVRIINRGRNGDLTSDMLLRFNQDVVGLKPKYVIILGGTNDIGWGLLITDIFNNLKKLFEMAKENGLKSIGCTVPSVLGWDGGIPPRLKLNRLLKGFYRSKGVWYADLFAKTSDPNTQRLKAEYSSDGLHLNAVGYRKIAETIFEDAIKGLISRELKPN